MPSNILPNRRVLSLVVAGGLVGSAIRVGIGEVVRSNGFPWGTIVVNLTGVAVIGFLLPGMRGRVEHMAVWIVGGGGAATTFSAFTVDAMELVESNRLLAAAGYVAVSLLGGFLVAVAATHVGRRR